jgi:hypothetical protein
LHAAPVRAAVRRHPRRAAPRRARSATLLASAVALALLAAQALAAPAARADTTDVNTDLTPVAQEGEKYDWKMFDGALFGRGGRMVGTSAQAPQGTSQTPFTVDFFTVRFDPLVDGSGLPIDEGFAGGAACKDRSVAFSDLGNPARCVRVPAVQGQQLAAGGSARRCW